MPRARAAARAHEKRVAVLGGHELVEHGGKSAARPRSMIDGRSDLDHPHVGHERDGAIVGRGAAVGERAGDGEPFGHRRCSFTMTVLMVSLQGPREPP